VQRRVSPWPDNLLAAVHAVCGHARTLPEATVQAQLPDALAAESAPGTAVPLGVAFKRQGARSALRGPRWFARRGCLTVTCISGCGLTFEFTRVRKRAKPAVALRVQRRVSPHGALPRMRANWERAELRQQTPCRRKEGKQPHPTGKAQTSRRHRWYRSRGTQGHRSGLRTQCCSALPQQAARTRKDTGLEQGRKPEACPMQGTPEHCAKGPCVRVNVGVHPPAEAGEARCSRSGATTG
jgi:hypothetical protein